MNVSYYFIKSMIECFSMNDDLPYIVIHPARLCTGIPAGFINNDQVTLNLSVGAVTNFNIDPVNGITFSARFNKVSHRVHVPLLAVAGIYGKLSGEAFEIPRSAKERADRNALYQVQQAVEIDPANTAPDAEVPIGKLSQAPVDAPVQVTMDLPSGATAVIEKPSGDNVVVGRFGQRPKN